MNRFCFFAKAGELHTGSFVRSTPGLRFWVQAYGLGPSSACVHVCLAACLCSSLSVSLSLFHTPYLYLHSSLPLMFSFFFLSLSLSLSLSSVCLPQCLTSFGVLSQCVFDTLKFSFIISSSLSLSLSLYISLFAPLFPSLSLYLFASFSHSPAHFQGRRARIFWSWFSFKNGGYFWWHVATYPYIYICVDIDICCRGKTWSKIWGILSQNLVQGCVKTWSKIFFCLFFPNFIVFCGHLKKHK